MFIIFFKSTATTEVNTYLHTFSLPDALPIGRSGRHPGTRVARGAADLRGPVLQRPRSGDPAAAGTETRSAALAQRHLARLVHRMRADRKSTRLNSSH